jgi:hypothetical protein
VEYVACVRWVTSACKILVENRKETQHVRHRHRWEDSTRMDFKEVMI